jgi:hypothetical protein
MNKRLLIFESHGDSNHCTPCRRKPNQYDTYASHTSLRTWQSFTSHRQSWTKSLLLRKRAFDTIHSTLANRSTSPYPVSLLSQPMKQCRKPNNCRQQSIRLIGLISPTCDRYVQYLLTGINPLVLNRHRRGLPHKNLRIATTLSPPFPSECSTGSPKWLSQSSFYPTLNSNNSECKSTYCRQVVFWPLGTYRHLYLSLANSIDLWLL